MMIKAYLAAVMLLAASSAAHALTLAPGGEFLSGNETSQFRINGILLNNGTDSKFLYKDNMRGRAEGPFAVDYTTS